MAGPELLEDEGSHLGRRRAWLLLGVVLVVVAALAALRLGRSGVETLPPPTSPPSVATLPPAQAWPAGLPAGTLVTSAGGRVSAIDTASGAVRRTGLDAERVDPSLTRLGADVLVWRAGSHTTQLLDRTARDVPVHGELRWATSFLPGPDGLVWAARTQGAGTTWRLTDPEGHVRRSVVVEGVAVGDGSGGLLEVRPHELRPVTPVAGNTWQPGDVVATGPGGYVVRDCSAPPCRVLLHDRRSGTDTTLRAAVGAGTSGGTLSPADRLLAVDETEAGTTTLRVSVVATGEVRTVVRAPVPPTDDAVWLDDRWLALVSADQLVLYDATDDRLVTTGVALHGLGALVWVPA